MREFLDYYAKGEEEAVFPAVDKVALLVRKAYFMDHRELGTMVSGLEAIRTVPNALTDSRQDSCERTLRSTAWTTTEGVRREVY
jgi:hypothetical protein